MTHHDTGQHLGDTSSHHSEHPVATIGLATVGTLEHRPDGDLLTLSEVAAILRVPVNTLRWWRQQGTGPHYFKLGRRLVTTVGDLTTWVEHQKNGTHPAA